MQDKENHIAAYLEGLLSKEEQTLFEQEYNSSPDFKKEVDDYRFIWEQAQLLKRKSRFHTHENWNQLQRRINQTSLFSRIWNRTRTAAAILLLPLGITIAYLIISQNNETINLTNQTITVTSAPGMVSKIILPDSSEVWLNSGTTLTYPQKFVNGKREVSLSGEAYFKVKSDLKNRFNVITPNDVTVSAYGTEFEVSANKDDSFIEAVLAKGHIEMETQDSPPVKLDVSQQANFNLVDKKLKVSRCNLSEKLDWIEGKIVFRKANINDIVQRLSRQFNANFTIQGRNLNVYEFSATFTNESLTEILAILGKVAPFKFCIQDPQKQMNQTYQPKKVTLILQK